MFTTRTETEINAQTERRDGPAEPLALVVDDELAIRRLVSLELRSQGFEVDTASSGEEAIDYVRHRRPSIVVLDLLMPGISGWDVLPMLRERGLPVIVLTARDTERERVRGLNMGADDYVTKPFSPEELSARVRAVLRRSERQTPTPNIIRAGSDVEIDLDRRMVRKQGRQLVLSRTEWRLLQHLAEHAGRTIPGTEILAQVWGSDYAHDLQYLRLWISRLRAKLEPDAERSTVIHTVPGVGYRLVADKV